MASPGVRLLRQTTAFLLVLVGTENWLQAQPAGAETKVIQPTDWTKLETKFKERKPVYTDILFGKVESSENPDVVDIAAQFYSYRVTWPSSQAAPGRMDGVIQELEKDLAIAVRYKPTTDPFLKMFADKMAKYSKDVIDSNSKAIARINSIRMIARLAELGLDETGELLVDEINQPKQIDAVKYYAIKGVRSLLAASAQPKSAVFSSAKGKVLKSKALLALASIVERKPPYPEAMTPEELNGFRKVRLEALKGISAGHQAAVLDDKGAIKSPLGLKVTQVLLNQGVVPGSSLEEQVEAAVGLAKFHNKETPTYQPKQAGAYLADFVVVFGLRYQNRVSGGRDAKEPWKFYGSQLSEALEEFRATNSAAKDLTELSDQCLIILRGIEDGGQVNPGELKIWLDNHPIKDSSGLFKGYTEPKPTEAPKETGVKPEAAEKKK